MAFMVWPIVDYAFVPSGRGSMLIGAKPGQEQRRATSTMPDVDAVTDPRTADRGSYVVFSVAYVVTRQGVHVLMSRTAVERGETPRPRPTPRRR